MPLLFYTRVEYVNKPEHLVFVIGSVSLINAERYTFLLFYYGHNNVKEKCDIKYIPVEEFTC